MQSFVALIGLLSSKTIDDAGKTPNSHAFCRRGKKKKHP
jgi:hypothetical protein